MKWRGLPRQLVPGVAAGLIAVAGLVCAGVGLAAPHRVTFAYSRPSCTFNPWVLPGMARVEPAKNFRLLAKDTVAAGGVVWLAGSTCVVATGMPGGAQTAAIKLGGMRQRFVVVPAAPPVAAFVPADGVPLRTDQHLEAKLSGLDVVDSYRLSVGTKSVGCRMKGVMLDCPVGRLGLAQSATYGFALQRVLGGSVLMAASRDFRTTAAISVTGSSIAPGELVYDQPQSISLTLSRPAQTLGNVTLLQDGAGPVAVNASVSGTTVTIKLSRPLDRKAGYTLTVDDVRAADGGHTSAPYSLRFTTSGGPQVTGVNIPGYGVAASPAIVITFDVPLQAGQFQMAAITAGAKTVGVTANVSKNQLSLRPNAPLGGCASFSVTVRSGLVSAYGVGGGAAWSYNSRTLCAVQFSIGTSVQGRPITAYQYGSGASAVVYVADIHGNEKSSTYTNQQWMNYLEANALRIPAGRSIIVIPTLNPDGFAANTRRNAHNVDLNRNFAANDWTPNVLEPDGRWYATGGGTAPLSEPEAAAMANLISAKHPRLVLSYHAVGGVVLPNGAADSLALAETYVRLSGLSYLSGNQSPDFFGYAATGALEGWTNDKLGIATLVIELRTEDGNEFASNRAAMWAMATTP